MHILDIPVAKERIMKKLLFLSVSLISSISVAATPVNQPIGSSFTLGGSVNKRALFTSMNNPAAPFLMVNRADDDNFRFGIVGPIGIGVEFGDVSDLEDRLEDVEDLTDSLSGTTLEDVITDVVSGGSLTPAQQAEIQAATTQEELEDLAETYSATLETAINDAISSRLQEAVDEANGILNGISDSAYVKAMVSSQVPFMPIIYRTDTKGAFTLDSSISAVFKGSVLEGDLSVVTDVDGNHEIESDASFYTQSAVDFNIGFGYSHPILQNSYGMLIGGAKANLHQISAGRSLVSFSDDDTDIGDAVSDSMDDGAAESTNVGLDLGIIWTSNFYQVGVTLANINQPEFDGAAIDASCTTDSCKAAQSLSDANDLELSDSYVMEMQASVDVAFSTREKQVFLGMSYDLNPVKDAVGDEYQWAAASLSYYSDSHFLPALRVGFRQNMAGSELSYASAGLTLLKRLSLDAAVALETVEDSDGEEIPRSLYVSLGYSTAF